MGGSLFLFQLQWAQEGRKIRASREGKHTDFLTCPYLAHIQPLTRTMLDAPTRGAGPWANLPPVDNCGPPVGHSRKGSIAQPLVIKWIK